MDEKYSIVGTVVSDNILGFIWNVILLWLELPFVALQQLISGSPES